MTEHEKAQRPEDLTRLFVERANAKDAAGIAALYEEHAVMAYPPGSRTVGRTAIRDLWEKLLPGMPRFAAGGAAPGTDQRRHRAHGDHRARRRGRQGAGGAPAAGRQLAPPARPAGVHLART